MDIPLSFVFPVVVELNGNIHVMGGGTNGVATDLHVRYTPSTDSWDTLLSVPYRAQQPAGAVVNGKIHYCGGGFPTSGQRLDLHFFYDPDSNAWFPAANLPVAVAIHKCVELDGKLYVFSGQPDKTLCESYDPVSDSWTQLNALPDMNFWYGIIVNAGNNIYRFGGGGYTAPTSAAHQYDKVNDTWTSIPSLPMPLHGSAGACVGDSLIWILGGYSAGLDQDKVWIYNINDQTYTITDSLPLERSYLSSVNAGGCVYSVGGNNNGAPQVQVQLLQNCSPNFPAAVTENRKDKEKPYSAIVTPSKFELQSDHGAIAARLVDMLGKTIQELTAGQGEKISFDAAGIHQGKYLVMIVSGEELFVEKWFVSKN